MSSDLAGAYAGCRVLVTGGLGFIGSHVARRLLELGAEVTVIDALVPGYGGNRFNVEKIEDQIEVVVADVRDAAALERCLEGRDYLLNLAGQVSHTESMSDPSRDLDNNCLAHLSVLEACRRLNPGVRIAFASTRQVYGRSVYLPMDESHPCQPVDVNGIHKLTAERYHLLYHEVYGIRSAVLRLTNTYGPGQLVSHPRQGFMGWFLRKVVEAGEIELMGDGRQLRDLNYVDDTVEALLLAAASPVAWGQVYNLGAGESIELLGLVRLMIEIAGRGSYRHVPFPPERKRIDVGSVTTDFGKIRTDLGWQPRIALREGLERSIRYYEQHLDRYLG